MKMPATQTLETTKAPTFPAGPWLNELE